MLKSAFCCIYISGILLSLVSYSFELSSQKALFRSTCKIIKPWGKLRTDEKRSAASFYYICKFVTKVENFLPLFARLAKSVFLGVSYVQIIPITLFLRVFIFNTCFFKSNDKFSLKTSSIVNRTRKKKRNFQNNPIVCRIKIYSDLFKDIFLVNFPYFRQTRM